MMGVYGGTFDPVHLGHLRPALEVQQALSLQTVRFIPCAQPPHREMPVAAAQIRLAMVRAAIARQPGFVADERELRRSGPSYMVDTLESLAGEFAGEPLCLILGMDAFAGFDRWHQWERITQLAHVVVTRRPGSSLEAVEQHPALGPFVQENTAQGVRQLQAQQAGLVYFVSVTQLAISATAIREAVRAGQDIRYLVPDSVYDIITQQNVYA